MQNKLLQSEISKVKDDVLSLNALSTFPLLESDKIEQLVKLKDNLLDAFEKQEMFRPKYLMRVSVLKDMKFPTPDSKYWQCLLERGVMFQNLISLGFGFQEKLADIEILRAEINELEEKNTKKSKARITKLQIKIKRSIYEMSIMQKEANERCREIIDWTELINELKPTLKYSSDNPEEHMPESYLIRFAEQKKIIDQIGATDMDGALNLIGLGKTASRFWKEKKTKNDLKR